MLKQLIQRLLESRTTPAQAGHNAMPSSASIELLSGGSINSEWNGNAYTGVAATDGYIVTSARATAPNTFLTIVSAEFTSTNMFFANTGTLLTSAFPISKGMRWTIMGQNVTEISVKLTKLIGGGYNHLVRRALSCLRALSNFSPKNSLLAEATGFLTNPIQLFKRRISRRQRQENGFLSSLLATGGSASKGLPRKFCLATGRFGRGAIQQRHLIKAFVSLSQKAGLWPTYYRQTPRAHTSSLLRVLVINNLQTGGALC